MKKTIADYPELAKEWHPTKNGDLMPCNVSFGSHKKVHWICGEGHCWEAKCKNRTSNRETGCPFCAGREVCKDNCLATTHPELAKEWHPTLNGNLTPSDVVAGSVKKVWWKCVVANDHEWESICYNRSVHKNGCPCCSNHKVCKDNCLSTTHPELAKEWHPTLNGTITPNDVLAKVNKKYWWLCEKGHEWQTSPNGKRGCPYCAKKKACKDNCLAATHPELAKEWHPTKNGNITPNDIIAGTAKKYWWICDKKHEWYARGADRASKDKKRGCPICNESKGEKKVAKILEKLNIPYQREFKFDDCKNIKSLPFDFKLNINNKEKIIEYHGGQHYEPCDFGSKKICKHENLEKIQQRDKIKKDFCESRGIPFLEISYKDYDKIEELITKFVEI